MKRSMMNLSGAPRAEDAVPNNFPTPRVAETQGPEPPCAPMSGHVQRQARFDIRDVRLANGWQFQSLRNALGCTRDSYREWTGEEAPVTNPEDCYNVQYREIETAFRIWWTSEKNPQNWEPLPELFRMKAWSGEVENWKAPENMEHLSKPMRRGRWAARNEDGSLQQPDFHWNYEDSLKSMDGPMLAPKNSCEREWAVLRERAGTFVENSFYVRY